MNKYSYCHTNADETIKLAIFNSINGDDAALIEIGGKSETFSDVIMTLIEYYRKHHKR